MQLSKRLCIKLMHLLDSKFHYAMLFVSLLVVGVSFTPPNITQGSNITLDKQVKAMPNVIVLIGDGMGPEMIKGASLVEYGLPSASIMDTDFPIQQLYNPNNVDNEITDSAAGATAIATGVLTSNEKISMDKDGRIYIKSILEYLEYDFGYATGLVSTMSFFHGTPAPFAAHTDNRENKESIRDQMLSKDIDVILSGGLKVVVFGSASAVQYYGTMHGYEVAVDMNELQNKVATSEKLLGVFPDARIPYELDRDPETIPGIVDMTEAAIEILDRKENPYFLMIEDGKIDYGGHAHNLVNTIMETIMFEKAVQSALNYAKNDGNTIVVVCSDHETGGLNIVDYSRLGTILPSTNNRTQDNEIRVERINQLNVTWGWTAHTETLIRFIGYGSDFGNHKVDRTNEIFWAINRVLGAFPTILNHTYTQVDDTLKLRPQ